MFTHPDEQCLDGYSGALCLVCATNYVKQGTTCTECSGGAVFLNAFLSMIGFAVVVFIVLLGVFLCAPSRKNADRGSGIFGQVKIILAFMQILAAMPGVFDNVSKGFIRSVLRLKRAINKLSFLFVHVRILTGALAIAIRQFYLFLEFRQFRFLVRLYEKFLQFVRPLPRPIRLAHGFARVVDAQRSFGLCVFTLLP